MMGTVLVCLPCKHEGGALVVRHNKPEDKVQRFEFAGAHEILLVEDMCG
jgi:hypothetical protein